MTYANTKLSEEEYRHASCTGKAKYDTWQRAADSIARKQDRNAKRRHIEIYHCDTCGSYHLATGSRRRHAPYRRPRPGGGSAQPD